MRSSAGRGCLVLALICGAIPIHAAQAIIVLRPGGTGWQVVEADKITFNQKEKLRTGSSQSPELGPDVYKKFPQVDIVRAGTLRRHAGGQESGKLHRAKGSQPLANARRRPEATHRSLQRPAAGEAARCGARRQAQLVQRL